MSGHVFALGPCFVCGQAFSFNPHGVPSFEGEPICESCMERVNAARAANGLERWPVRPDAYEAIPEGQL